MKRLILLALSWSPVFSFAQSWTETFDNNDRGWPTESDDDHSRQIANGKYILKTFKEGSGEFTSAPAFFDNTKDFTLRATFVQRDGSVNNGIGLYWGYVSGKIYNLFVFTTNGYYKIGESGTEGWTQTDLVQPLNQENYLEVQKRGETVSYFLNGKLVTTNQLASHGFTAGFITYTNMTLEVDNFHFDQDNKINLAANSSPGSEKENLGSGVNSTAFDLL